MTVDIRKRRPGTDVVPYTLPGTGVVRQQDQPAAAGTPDEIKINLSHGGHLIFLSTAIGNFVMDVQMPMGDGLAYLTRAETRQLVNAAVAMMRETRERSTAAPVFGIPASAPDAPTQMNIATVLIEMNDRIAGVAGMLLDTGEWPRVRTQMQRLAELSAHTLTWT